MATSTTVVYTNRWMTVREDKTLRHDGAEGTYGLVDKPDFALVVPYADDGFYLVEQYRYPVKGRYWEFPQDAPSVAAWPSSSAIARSTVNN